MLASGCSGKITRQHFNVEYEEGFWRSYAYTEIKGSDGKPIPGSQKLTICNGYGGLVSDLMKNAAVVGSAALIGGGLGSSGDTSTSNTRIDNSSNSGSSANATAGANSNSSSFSKSETGFPKPPAKNR